MPKGSQLKDSGKLGRGMTTLPHFLAGGGEMGCAHAGEVMDRYATRAALPLAGERQTAFFRP